MPGVQYPHWNASSARKASCTTCNLPAGARPSMVVIFLSATFEAATRHDLAAKPSISTVQAPHCPSPQPYFVPVRPRRLRNAHSSDSPGATSTSCSEPFTSSFMPPSQSEHYPSLSIRMPNPELLISGSPQQ